MAETTHIPGAWYDLSSRLDAARAVAGITCDYLPYGEHAIPIMSQVNQLGSLITAISNLLDLAIADTERLELEIKTGRPQ